MFFHSVFMEFVKFCCFYIILKAAIQLLNIEARRSGVKLLSAVSGLFA